MYGPQTITELTDFQITVTKNGVVNQPVAEATVTFNSLMKTSDQAGHVHFTAPEVDVNKPFTVTAVKSGFNDGIFLLTVIDTSGSPQLLLTAPSSIIEGRQFTVTVSVNGQPLAGASVTFNGQIITTDTTGNAQFIAPLVDQTQQFIITAQMESFLPVTASITVVDQPAQYPHQDLDQGWIYGTVTNTTQIPLQDALVCASLATSNSIANSLCIFTNEKGEYTLTLPSGTYTVTASKDGYEKSIVQNILVKSGELNKVDFTLKEITQSTATPTTNVNDALIKNVIKDGINKRIIGVELELTTVAGVSTFGINSYSNAYTIQHVQNKQPGDLLTFTISAENGTNGTFVVVYIGNDSIDPQNITVIYDGQELSIMSIDDFFNPQGRTEPGYVVLTSSEGFWLAIWNGHFSTHMITITAIQSAVEAVGGIYAVMTYMVICAVAAVFFIGTIQLRKRR
jgi:hypothetical protein